MQSIANPASAGFLSNGVQKVKSSQYETEILSFLESNLNRAWLEFQNLRVYVRKAERIVFGKRISCIDIASVSAYKQGRGTFTEFLEAMEKHAPVIYVENILTSRFADYFRKRGYRVGDTAYGLNWEALRDTQE